MTTSRTALVRARRDGGQVTVELLGYVPYLLIFFFMIVQMFAYITSLEEAESAARAGARVYSQGGDGNSAAREALPDRLRNEHTKIDVYGNGDSAEAKVTVQVPILFTDNFDWTVTRDASIPIG